MAGGDGGADLRVAANGQNRPSCFSLGTYRVRMRTQVVSLSLVSSARGPFCGGVPRVECSAQPGAIFSEVRFARNGYVSAFSLH